MTREAIAKQPTIRDMLETKRPEIKELLPVHVNANRFIKSALICISQNQVLQKCSPASLFLCVVDAAELGLDFTKAKGHAYMVPFFNNKKGVYEAQFMPGYRGLIDLARRSGSVKKIEAHLVYEKDKFSLKYGVESTIIHEPLLIGDRGKVIGAYAVAFFADTLPQFEYMTAADIDAIKARSKAATKGPWVTDSGEMQRKTPIRRLSKLIPISPDYQDKWDKAIEADNKAIGLIDVDIATPLEDGEKTRMLSDKLDAAQVAPSSPAPPPAKKRGRPKKRVGADLALTPEDEAVLPHPNKDQLAEADRVIGSKLIYQAMEALNIKCDDYQALTEEDAGRVAKKMNELADK